MAKHLSYDDRLDIEKYLKSNYSLSEIARELNRHKSTISREINIRSRTVKKGCYGRNYNACIHRYSCESDRVCSDKKCSRKYKHCKFCGRCNDYCEYFRVDHCEKLQSTPYVCNGCEDKRGVR